MTVKMYSLRRLKIFPPVMAFVVFSLACLCPWVAYAYCKQYGPRMEQPNPQGGGGYSHFSSYVGSGPASTIHPQKYQEFQALQIKNIPHSVP